MMTSTLLKIGRQVALFMLLAGAAAQAPAQEEPARVDQALLGSLATGDMTSKLDVISQLGRVPDPMAATVLEALSSASLFADPQGRILIRIAAAQARDPATGETLALPENATAVLVNNRLRRAITDALAASQLFSEQASVRLAAAMRMQRRDDDAHLALIDRALAQESSPQVRAALETARASQMLGGEDPETRIQAIQALGGARDASFRPRLASLLDKDDGGAHAEPDERVRAAAAEALEQIDAHLTRIEWAGNLFYGLSLGSVLLLAALGLAITFGLMGVINMAHGELLMIGAYVTYLMQLGFRQFAPLWMDWYVIAALPAAFVVTALVGMALERTVIRWLYGRPLETLLATWGISLILMQGVRTLFGAQNVEVGNPGWMSGGVTVLGGLVLSHNRIAIIVFALSTVAFVWFLLNHTRLGLFVRAITQDRRMADCVGVPTGRIDMFAFGLGSGIAGLGGVALSQLGNVGPDLGRGYLVDSFMVVVLGGVGQLAGTVIAAFGLGGINKLMEPYTGAVMAKIMILTLIVLFVQKRPQGLFAARGRSME